MAVNQISDVRIASKQPQRVIADRPGNIVAARQQLLGQFATFEIDLSSEARPPVELARFLNRRGEVAWLTKAGKALVDRAFELD